MAASETVRLRLQFDYPPPATPDCTIFWLLVDLSRCRVVTDLISLVRQRFGFSSGACLGLYLDGGLLPPGESARLVRDNDCIRVKLEESCVTDSSEAASYGADTSVLSRKTKKRAFKFVEDEESDPDYTYPRKHCKQQENSYSNEEILDQEPKTVTDQSARKKTKRNNKAACEVTSDDDKGTKRKASKKKEKDRSKRRLKNPKPPKTQVVKERTLQNCSPPKGSPARNSPAKVKKRGVVSICANENPSSSSESEDLSTYTSDGLGNVGVTPPLEKKTRSAKERPSLKSTTSNKGVTKTSFNQTPVKSKANKTPSSSSSDSSSESDNESREKQGPQEQAADFSKTTGRGCPGPLKSQTPGAPGWKHSDSNGGRQAPGPPFNLSLPANLGRGWGRGGDLLPWKGARGRGMRGRGRGRGQAMPSVSNRNNDCQPQQQLNDVVTNSSVIIQNPVEVPKKDYSMLPLLAAPQVGEKIVFKLLELTSDYSPDISDYKEGKILSHNPETQQVDIEILSSLPVVKEPGKFDLVYHNENGTEVVEYAVTQEKKITAVWGELIEPRLILESPSSNTADTDLT